MWETVIQNKLCRIGLKNIHVAKCTDGKECVVDGCSRYHHALFHKYKSIGLEATSVSTNVQ